MAYVVGGEADGRMTAVKESSWCTPGTLRKENLHAVGLHPEAFQLVAACTGYFRQRAVSANVSGRNATCAIVGKAAGGNENIATLCIGRKPEALGRTGSGKTGVDSLDAGRDGRAAR